MAEPEFSLITANATNTQKLWGGENKHLKVAGGPSLVLQGFTWFYRDLEGLYDASAMGWPSGSNNPSHYPAGT